MTPEEIALKLVHEMDGRVSDIWNLEENAELIADAIRSAVEEEREECAKICDEAYGTGVGAGTVTAGNLARRIRARGEKK